VEPEPVVKPIEQQTIVETVRQVEQVQPTVREVPQQEVREVKPVVETLPQPVAVVSRPVETQKPLSEPESVVVASAPPAPVVSQQAETRITEVSTTPASVAEQPPVKEVVKEAPAPPAPALEARIKEPDRPASPSPALVQEAKAAPPMPAARTHVKKDFGWLAKTLWDRVVHLKRYPHAARMHHIEGRVVVRAVIREDGHLVEAAVLQSSGHEVLDHDALEIVRRACPLKLARELGRPEVVVQVPISYKLEN
jgi:protein TonB